MISTPEAISLGTKEFDERAFTAPSYSFGNRCMRAFWGLVYQLFFRPSPRVFHGWRRFILRCFGASVGPGCRVYPKSTIWAPWNLTLGKVVLVADGAEIYNHAPVVIGDYSVISQQAYLCTASHNYASWRFTLVSQPIQIGSHAWVASRAIVGMGVTIGDGTVIGVGSVVMKSMPAWWVCAGNPCKPIKAYEKKYD